MYIGIHYPALVNVLNESKEQQKCFLCHRNPFDEINSKDSLSIDIELKARMKIKKWQNI